MFTLSATIRRLPSRVRSYTILRGGVQAIISGRVALDIISIDQIVICHLEISENVSKRDVLYVIEPMSRIPGHEPKIFETAEQALTPYLKSGQKVFIHGGETNCILLYMNVSVSVIRDSSSINPL